MQRFQLVKYSRHKEFLYSQKHQTIEFQFSITLAKMHLKCVPLLLAAGIILSGIVTLAGSCHIKFKDNELHGNVSDECLVKLNLTEMDLDLENQDIETYLSGTYDDKCMGKCFYISMKLMKPNGVIDKQYFITYLGEQAPAELTHILLPLARKCIDTHNQAIKVRQNLKPDLCVLAYKLNICLNKGWMEAC